MDCSPKRGCNALPVAKRCFDFVKGSLLRSSCIRILTLGLYFIACLSAISLYISNPVLLYAFTPKRGFKLLINAKFCFAFCKFI